jgi:LPXTG-site transpeptidase (sortase) family protein
MPVIGSEVLTTPEPILPFQDQGKVRHRRWSIRRGKPDRPAVTSGAPLALGPYLSGSALTVLGALLAAFIFQLLVLSPVQHARAQRISYAMLRSQLAQAIAPVGQVDADNRVLALGSPEALLEIPTLGLREVVGEGTTSGVLTAGPGHERDSVLPGQAGTSVIFGRKAAYGGPFRHLDRLRAGDRITVQTAQGSQRFTVIDLRRAGDPQPGALPTGAGRLTLVTATGSAYRPIGPPAYFGWTPS